MERSERTERIRYAVVGTGWRALFYVRAARMLPENFELVGVLCRTQERAQAFAEAYGVPTFWDAEALLKRQPNFVVSCVNKQGMAQMVGSLLAQKMPVLSETPFATDEETLLALYAAMQRTGTKLMLAEQYFLYPTHQARRAVVERGFLGAVQSCFLSAVHDYHAVSLMRLYMGEETLPLCVTASRSVSPIIVTGGRGGFVTDGEIGQEMRTYALMTYADGRVCRYDFSGTQYHSAIRSNHVCLQGTHGELFDGEVRFLSRDHRPLRGALSVCRDELSGTIRAIDFEGERVYTNPFRTDAAMSEDEIAVCGVLMRMGAYVRGGEIGYPIRQAFRDGYFSCLLHRAAESGQTLVSEKKPWDEA